MNKDIIYIVKLKPEMQDELRLTTIKREFCGKFITRLDDTFVFELNGSEAQVIVPYNAIEWMAPSKVHWELTHEADPSRVKFRRPTHCPICGGKLLYGRCTKCENFIPWEEFYD